MKKKNRKLLLQKYLILIFLSTLSLLYLYLVDWMFGYGFGNIGYILNYLLYTASEKTTAVFLLLCLLVPDIISWIRGSQPGREAEK
jgi:hypothetical protein